MTLRCLLALLCLAAPVMAQDAPKPASPEWQWLVPSRAALQRFAKLSEGARTRLQAELASNSKAIKSLSLDEYNARFEKALRAAVQEDEAKGLSSGGMPDEVFTARKLVASPGQAATDDAKTARTGPTAEQKARWNKLSPQSQAEVKAFFSSSRELLMSMSEEERRSFFETNMKRIEEADATTQGRTGPTSEQRARWGKLTDTAKEKFKKRYVDNRARFSTMNDDERRAFFETSLKLAEQPEEAAASTGK